MKTKLGSPHRRWKGGALAAFVLITVSSNAAPPNAASTWPQFRGLNAAGIANEATPPIKFSPTEGVLWSVDIPWSPSSPCVWGDRIFLTTFDQGSLETRCYNRSDGRLLWKKPLKPEGIEEYHRADGSPAASTPATDGTRVISYFGSFGLVCHDFEGRELWRHPLPLAESGGRFGSGTSPIIVQGRVVVNRDQHNYSSLLALDLQTGKVAWETSRADATGSFGTPALWRNNGVDEIVLAGSARLKGYALKDGAERWVIDGVTGMVCTTAIVGDEMLYFAAWSPGQSDSPRQPLEEFVKRNDVNKDGIATVAELPEERRDYIRALDRNRDGKFTQEDWDIMKRNDARAENVLIAVKPGGTGNISESHVAWKYKKALPYVKSKTFLIHIFATKSKTFF